VGNRDIDGNVVVLSRTSTWNASWYQATHFGTLLALIALLLLVGPSPLALLVIAMFIVAECCLILRLGRPLVRMTPTLVTIRNRFKTERVPIAEVEDVHFFPSGPEADPRLGPGVYVQAGPRLIRVDAGSTRPRAEQPAAAERLRAEIARRAVLAVEASERPPPDVAHS
jgi:hypothetical protein